MKNARVLALAAVLVTLAALPGLAAKEQPLPKDLPPYGAEKPLPVPEVEELKLDNGLTVWVVARPDFPKVTALLVMRGGTAADPKEMEGVSEVFADVLKEGTATRSARQIAEQLQAVGGEINVGSGDDAVTVYADGLSTGAKTVLEIIADVARNASFPDNEVDLAKTNALQGLMARESTPEFPVSKAFAAAVYGDHPYRIVAPTKEIIQKVTPALLRGEHARRFRPDHGLLLIVGAVDPKAMQQYARSLFADWQSKGEPIAATPPSPGGGARRILIIERPGSVQSEIRVGRTTPKATDPDYHTLLVANTIFGGAFSSRLIENIREDKGYTYSPRVSVATFEQGGLLSIRASVRTEVTAGALLEIFYELDRMATTDPTANELERAKRYQSGLYLLRNQTQGALARTLATNWVNGLPPAALGEFVPKIDAVTSAQVREVGKKLMTSASQTVVIGGSSKQIATDVAPFGKATVVTP
jgi:zinc protease